MSELGLECKRDRPLRSRHRLGWGGSGEFEDWGWECVCLVWVRIVVSLMRLIKLTLTSATRGPACTGENKPFAPTNSGNDNEHAEIHDLRASCFEGKVLSLFCEASRSFSSFDPDQGVDVTHDDNSSGRRSRRGLSSSVGGKSSRRSRRGHTKRLPESTLDAYLDEPENKPSKASLLLNPWKPDPGRSRTATTLCGDGLFYAAGGDGGAGGCISPDHKRSVGVKFGGS